MSFDLGALPVQCDIDEDESGYGFLLRCSRANGMTYDQLLNHAGARTPIWLRADDIELLAFLTSVRPAQLAGRIRQRQTIGGRREFNFMDQRWMSAVAFRVRSCQVCPDCIRERGRCLWAWELAGCCACTRHGTYLIDRCIHCSKHLSWRRLAVDICQCGRYLASVNTQSAVPAGVLGWCQWLQERCSTTSPTKLRCNLPLWLTQGDPDGAFALIMALGRKLSASHHLTAADAVRALTPLEMGACLQRAFDRASEIASDGMLPSHLSAVVDESLLERLERYGVDERARRIARQFLRRMHRRAPLSQLRHPWRNARPCKGQLELFDDGDPSTP